MQKKSQKVYFRCDFFVLGYPKTDGDFLENKLSQFNNFSFLGNHYIAKTSFIEMVFHGLL